MTDSRLYFLAIVLLGSLGFAAAMLAFSALATWRAPAFVAASYEDVTMIEPTTIRPDGLVLRASGTHQPVEDFLRDYNLYRDQQRTDAIWRALTWAGALMALGFALFGIGAFIDRSVRK